MADNLQILISASLNTGLSLKNLNENIAALEKHPSLRKIKLQIEVDPRFIQSINGFITATSKLSKTLDDQNKTVKEVQTVFKQLDGSISTTTQKILKNGEVIEKTRIVHDANKKAMQEESGAAHKLAQSIEEANKAGIESVKVNRNKLNAITGYNVKSSQGYTVTNTRLESDGKTLVGSNSLTSYKKEKQDLEKLDRDHFNALKDNNKRNEDMDRIHYLALKKNRELAATQKVKDDKDYEALDRAHYNALKGNKQRIEAMEKMHYLALQQNRNKDLSDQRRANTDKEQLLAKQRSAEVQVANLTRRYGTNIDSQGLNNLLSQMKALNTTSANYRQEATRLQHEISKIGASAQSSSAHTLKFGEALKTALTKFPVWMLSATIFYAPIRGMQAMVKTVIEVDSQMTQLKRVMDQDTNFNRMLSESVGLANQLGRSVTEVNDAMIEFARQGFDENQVLDLAKSAVLAQNISEMSSTEATNALTAAMTVFNITAKDSIGIINRINEIDNNFAVTSQNLAVAMTKAGSSAKTFGVSLEEMLGNATAVMAATRESGAIVGNSLKTIYSRMTTMKASKDILDSVGISIHDMGGNIRSVTDILGDLAGKFKSLSSEQQQNIGVTLAGKQICPLVR